YYRFPTLHGDRVVFVCEDDLWSVPVGGGVAVRLTANLGEVSHPMLSPDGQQIAFVGREEGHAEVYVMPAAGGSAERLTFLGVGAQVVGWSPDGASIIFASSAGQPFRRLTQLHSVSAEGGLPQLLPYGMAHKVSFGPQGGELLGRNIGDPARWKRYRGGLAGVMWIDVSGDGRFERLLDLQGNIAAPMWVGDRIYFISDHGGIGNLYSCTPLGEDLQQLTNHSEYYLRNATTDGQRIVYHAGADLFYFDVASGREHRISVEFHSPHVQRQRKFVDPGHYLEDYDLHPKGHATLITSRGQSFSFGHWEGAVMPLKPAESGRYRLTQWLPDGERFVAVSVGAERALSENSSSGETTQTGTEVLTVLSADFETAPVRLEGLDVGRVVDLKVSPVGNQVALSNHRHELIWVDLDSQQSRVMDRSAYQRIHGFDWSSDGAWVVYGFSETQYTSSIKLCRVDSGEAHRLTSPRFFDYDPSFDPQGKFIYFLSMREFNPVYDSVYFDLNFPRATRPFLISLQRDTLSPFVPLPRPIAEDEKEDEVSDKDSGRENSGSDDSVDTGSPQAASSGDRPNEARPNSPEPNNPEPVAIDLDGIAQRVAGFPVSEGRYMQIAGLKDGVLFSSEPIQGSLGGNWASTAPAADAKIEIYDFKTQSCELVAEKVTDFKIGPDHSTLVYRSGDRLRVCAAKAQPEGDDGDGDEPSRKTGWLDLERVRISVLPQQEWQQMLAEIWGLQRDHFWTEDLSGVDWRRVYQRYRPLLDRVSTRSEFSDLVWEMQGELGTSHAYEMGGDYREEPDYALGFLGADFSADGDAYRITHIAQGDSWSKQASPLQEIGVNIQAGDRLLAINGQRLTPQVSPHEMLVHQAGCRVQLTVARNGERRTVTVKALESDRRLRYREWVERNYQRVTAATEGRVGYVHIPDMGPQGYAEFHRYYFAEVHKEGLLVDVRFNGGGHVSQLILEKLARQRIGYDVPRWEQPEPYPSDSMAGPIVALTNEHAGSDGDIFSHCFKLMNIGPLIGTRTWGGVIGIWPRHQLIDHSIVTQPEYSFWFKDVGWRVENYGTDPTIPVEVPPHDWAAGQDPQLQKGIEVILRQLAENPVKLPDFSDRPRLHLP
ncbi:MAG: S41 family peptidase, partial [Elainellaceae cyanobacterium]